MSSTYVPSQITDIQNLFSKLGPVPVAHNNLYGTYDNTGTTTGYTSYGSESQWFTLSGFRSIQVDLSGLYLYHSNHLETPIAGPMNVQMWVEYPLGTTTALTFSGSTGVAVQPTMQNLKSDELFLSIPASSTFGIVYYISGVSSSFSIPVHNQVDSYQDPSGITVETYSGFSTNPSTVPPTSGSRFGGTAGSVSAPYAVYGRPLTTTPTVAIASDSIGSGIHDIAQKNRLVTTSYAKLPMSNCLGWVSNAFAGNCNIINFSQSGDFGSDFMNSGNMRKNIAKGASVFIYALGTNDIIGGATLTQLQTYATDAFSYAKAMGMIVCAKTLLPITSSTSTFLSFVTGEGQTQGLQSLESIRLAYNSWLRSNPQIQVLIDDDTLISNGGLWPTYSVVYSGTGNVTSTGYSIGTITDSGLSAFTTNSLANPSDNLGPYMYYITSSVSGNTGKYGYVWSNSGNTLVLNQVYGNSSQLVHTSPGDTYIIADPRTLEGVHPTARTYTQIGNLAWSKLQGYL